MKSDFGFKVGILPDHCGNCVFLDWEEFTCVCTHPAFVDDDELIEYLRDELGPDESEDEVVALANSLYEMRQDDSDWHGYNAVCKLHTKITNREIADAAIGTAMDDYREHAVKLWKNRPLEKKEG